MLKIGVQQILKNETFSQEIILCASLLCAVIFVQTEYCKYLIPLDVKHFPKNKKNFQIVFLRGIHKGYPTFQLVSRFAKMGYEDI